MTHADVLHGFPEEDLRESGEDNPGYFRAWLGMQLEQTRYCIVRKLGWGLFSSVWLVRDSESDRYAALKIMTRTATERFKAGRSDEIVMLQKIASANDSHPEKRHLVELWDTFDVVGSQGLYTCVATEVLGPSLETLRSQAGPELQLPLHIVKTSVRQILLGLDYLHTSCGIIHTDLKFDNIMIRIRDVDLVIARDLVKNPSRTYMAYMEAGHSPFMIESQPVLQDLSSLGQHNLEVVIADFGHSHWVHHHFKEIIQPAALRAPEVILGYGWNQAADIWAMGCLVTELLVGSSIFSWDIFEKKWDMNEDQLAQMTEVCEEEFTLAMLERSEHRAKYFKDDGTFIHSDDPREPNMAIRKILTQWAIFGSQEQEVDAAVSFLKRCLRLQPEARATAKELAEDVWLQLAEENV